MATRETIEREPIESERARADALAVFVEQPIERGVVMDTDAIAEIIESERDFRVLRGATLAESIGLQLIGERERIERRGKLEQLDAVTIIGRAARAVARQFAGIDAGQVESETIRRVALTLGGYRSARSMREPLSITEARAVVTDERHLAGYARRVARSIAKNLGTGRGSMHIDGACEHSESVATCEHCGQLERVEASPNFSPWVAANGATLANGLSGSAPLWETKLARPDDVFHDSLVDRAITARADAKDTLALALAIEHATVTSRSRHLTARGSVWCPWQDVASDYAAITGDPIASSTARRMVERAIESARRADNQAALDDAVPKRARAIERARAARIALERASRDMALSAIRERIERERANREPMSESERADARARADAILSRIERRRADIRESERIERERAMVGARIDAWSDLIERRHGDKRARRPVSDPAAIARIVERIESERESVAPLDRASEQHRQRIERERVADAIARASRM